MNVPVRAQCLIGMAACSGWQEFCLICISRTPSFLRKQESSPAGLGDPGFPLSRERRAL